MRWWPEPTAGEIVWCHFPDNIHPKPKPRPGLIVSTKEDAEGMIFVSVAYGTSQKTDRLFSGEFRIAQSEQPSAYTSAGLSFDTKFDLRNVVELPFNDAYFSVPPHAPQGQIPKLALCIRAWSELPLPLLWQLENRRSHGYRRLGRG
jgi:hypothetical protein